MSSFSFAMSVNVLGAAASRLTYSQDDDEMMLQPNEGVVASAQDPVTATLAGIETLRSGWELLTVYVGTGVDATAVDTLTRAIAARYPDAEVELVDGGQPHYDFLIAAE